MILNSIKLENFRSHSLLKFEFKKGINVFEGQNGVGKTNIAEAIYYLSLARSFRKTEDEKLIKDGKEYAVVEGVIDKCGIKKKISITLTKRGKRILINNKKVLKISELSNTVNAIIFEPKDVLLFKTSPKERRNYLDLILCKKSIIYLENLTKYEKLLKSRNSLLKSEKIDQKLLDVITSQIIEVSEKIITFRQVYVKDINDILNNITRALTHTRANVVIKYNPFVPYNSSYFIEANNAYKKSEELDKKTKTTNIGIHREDFHCEMNGKNIAEYGSQGENRMVVLALKLVPYLLEKDEDKKPIIILDDVMSELDEQHQTRLLNLLKKFDQVFITTTKLKINDANHYQIK